jgi:hypothetical protein
MQNLSAIAGRFITGGIKGKRRVIGRKRLMRPGKCLQSYSFVVESLRIAIAVLRREIVGGECFLQAPKSLENIPSAELRLCVRRAAMRASSYAASASLGQAFARPTPIKQIRAISGSKASIGSKQARASSSRPKRSSNAPRLVSAPQWRVFKRSAS